MAAAYPPSRETAAGVLVEEKNVDHQANSLEFRLNLLALFAVKAFTDKDIEDFRIWAIRNELDNEEPFIKDVILAYKQRRHHLNNGWYCLIVPAEIEETMKNDATSHNTSAVDKNHVTYFQIYSKWWKDQQFFEKISGIDKIMFYSSNSVHLKSSNDMVEDSENKDYIFHCKLFQFGDNYAGGEEIWKHVREELLEPVNDDVQMEMHKKKCREFLNLDSRHFFQRVAFVSECPRLEELQKLAKMELKTCICNPYADSFSDKLINVVCEKLHGILEKNGNISGSEVRALLEDLKLGIVEGPKFLFNLSDPVSNFVGRGKELRQILYLLGGTSGHWQMAPPRKLVLAGFGGVGKSELVREYCKRHFLSLYDYTVWINAETAEGIETSFKILAFEKLGIEKETPSGEMKGIVAVAEETFDRLKKWRTLLVYDNVESHSQIREYLPSHSLDARINVIITSRSQHWNDFPLILLDNFHPKEALDLVKKSLGHLSIWCEEPGIELCKTLGYFPLALKQALSYIVEQVSLSKGQGGRKYSIQEYLKTLESNIEPLLSLPISGNSGGNYSETMCNVMSTTLKYLENTTEGHMGLSLLNVLSYLSPDCIEIDTMRDANPKYGNEFIAKGFSILSKLSIVSLSRKKVRVHRIIQTMNRCRLRNVGLNVDVMREAMCFAMKMGVQHMVSVWNSLRDHKSLVKEYAFVPHMITNKLFVEGLHEFALNFSRSTLEPLKNVLGSTHPSFLYALSDLALAYECFGDIKNATEKMKECVDAWRNRRGPKHPNYFLTLSKYGNLLISGRKIEKALPAFREILSNGPFVVGKYSDLILITRARLIVTESLCNPGLADENGLKDIEDWIKQRLGTEKGMGLCSTNGARNRKKDNPFLHSGMGGYDERNNYGLNLVRLNYAAVLFARGKLRESVEEVQMLTESLKNEFGEKHVLTLKCKYLLVKLNLKIGRVSAAEEELGTLSLQLGPFGRNVLGVSIEDLKYCIMIARGRTKEAITHIISCCLNKSSDSVDEDGLWRVRETIQFAMLYEEYKFVTSAMKKIFQVHHAHAENKMIPIFFLKYSMNVAQEFRKHGLHKEALTILKEVYQHLKDVNGEGHIETLQVKFAFAVLYCHIGGRMKRNNGVRYLMELQSTLMAMDGKRDKRVEELLHLVKVSLKNYIAETNLSSLFRKILAWKM